MGKFSFILEYNEYINSVLNFEEPIYSDEYIYKKFLDNYKGDFLPIKEGLIYSQPADTTIRILKKKFKELKIKYYDDGGDISIEGMDDKLKKYIPLINNLGYFISSAFIGDDNIDLNEKELEEVKCTNIFIEPKYDYEVEIPKILYHASPLKFKDKIIKNGLIPKSGNKISIHPERIYLSDSFESCIKFGEYLSKNTLYNKHYKNGYCVFIIKGGVDKLYSDINFREGGFYTLNNISKEFITLFKKVER